MADYQLSGLLAAAASVTGNPRQNRFHMAGTLDGSAGYTSAPIGWHMLAGKVRSQGVAAAPDACATTAIPITPSDHTTFSPPLRWLWVGGTGDVCLRMNDGSTFVFTSVAAGTRLPVSATMVFSTLTTASALVGCR